MPWQAMHTLARPHCRWGVGAGVPQPWGAVAAPPAAPAAAAAAAAAAALLCMPSLLTASDAPVAVAKFLWIDHLGCIPWLMQMGFCLCSGSLLQKQQVMFAAMHRNSKDARCVTAANSIFVPAQRVHGRHLSSGESSAAVLSLLRRVRHCQSRLSQYPCALAALHLFSPRKHGSRRM